MRRLQEEAELEEIVRLVGVDALSDRDQLVLEAARSIREDFLHQDAFHEVDTYCSLTKQYKMLRLAMAFYDVGQRLLREGVSLAKIRNLPIREEIGRVKYIPEDRHEEIDRLYDELQAYTGETLGGGEENV